LLRFFLCKFFLIKLLIFIINFYKKTKFIHSETLGTLVGTWTTHGNLDHLWELGPVMFHWDIRGPQGHSWFLAHNHPCEVMKAYTMQKTQLNKGTSGPIGCNCIKKSGQYTYIIHSNIVTFTQQILIMGRVPSVFPDIPIIISTIYSQEALHKFSYPLEEVFFLPKNLLLWQVKPCTNFF